MEWELGMRRCGVGIEHEKVWVINIHCHSHSNRQILHIKSSLISQPLQCLYSARGQIGADVSTLLTWIVVLR